jgi:hypothetical protein
MRAGFKKSIQPIEEMKACSNYSEGKKKGFHAEGAISDV